MFEIQKDSCRSSDACFIYIKLLFCRKVGLICLFLSKVLSQVSNEYNIVEKGLETSKVGATVPQKILNQSLFVFFRELCTVEQIFRRVAPEKGVTQPRRAFYLFLTLEPSQPPSSSLRQHCHSQPILLCSHKT